MYRKYQTNQQAWNDVTHNYNESQRKEKICQKLFGQKNLYGLTTEQRELFWKSI